MLKYFKFECLKKEGAIAADDVQQLAKNCDRILTIIPTPNDVLDIYTRPNGILAYKLTCGAE